MLNVVGKALSRGGGMTPKLQADIFPQLAREATGDVGNDCRHPSQYQDG